MSLSRLRFIVDDGLPLLVVEVLKERKWEEISPGSRRNDGDWQLYWKLGRFPVSFLANLSIGSKVNHFCNSSLITQKDKLIRSISRLSKMYGKHVFDFIPKSFCFPLDRAMFEKKAENQRQKIWIGKPAGSSQGRGIQIFCDSAQALQAANQHHKQKFIIQEYLIDAHCIMGYKYDLRLYVLVTSLHPLKVFLYDNGLVRFCTKKYSKNIAASDIIDPYVHLSNTTINKESPTSKDNNDDNDFYSSISRVLGEGSGPKFELIKLFTFYEKEKKTESLRKKIDEIIVLTMCSLCVNTVLSRHGHDSCFELFGFDILIDEAMKPWLLEVNFSPSLGCDCYIDEKIKKPMLNSVFDILYSNSNSGSDSDNNGFRRVYPLDDSENISDIRKIVNEVKKKKKNR